MRFGNAVTVLLAIGGTPPTTAARKKKLRHNKPTPPERREQELSMSVDYIMDSLKTPEGIMDTEQSFSEIFHWMPDGPKVEICEPYWGSVKVNEEWVDHFSEAEICGTQVDNVCYETDLSCKKQKDGRFSCVTVAKPVDWICGTQEDVCHDQEKTCQSDGDEADTLTCQTVPSSIGSFCDTNACLDSQACDGRGTCVGGQDNCPNHGTECGGTCGVEGKCSFLTTSCTKDLCSEGGLCDGGVEGICLAVPKDCDDGKPCTDDSCDLDTGLCAHDNNDENSCADSIPECFIDQVCKNGQCVGEDNCAGFGTTCGGICSGFGENGCVYPDTDVTCDKDGDLCLPGNCAGDTSGTCVVSSSKCDDDDPCTVSECDSHTGKCKSHPAKDGTWCDSLPDCFDNQVCTDGQCGGKDTCTGFGVSPCGGTCSLTNDTCVYPEDSVSCFDDGDKNKCRPGFCSEGTCDYIEKVCPEKTCEVGTCQIDTGTCEYKDEVSGTDCDTIDCFSNQTCNGEGACMATGDDNCEDDTDDCEFPTCNADSGLCDVMKNELSGTNCNTIGCFISQKCDGGGTCMAGTDICRLNIVDVNDVCYGTCDTGSGSCTNYTATNDESCNGPCDAPDSGYCSLGSCTNTTAKNCGPETPGTCYGTCNGSTGACNDYGGSNGGTCNDNHVCTKNDKCSGGTCAGNTPICSGGNVCWEDRTGSCFSGPNETVAGEFFCCPEDSDYGFSGGAENGYPCIAGDSYSGVLECQD